MNDNTQIPYSFAKKLVSQGVKLKITQKQSQILWQQQAYV